MLKEELYKMMRTLGLPNYLALSGIAILFGALALGLLIWAIIDCLASNKNTNEKILWILIILFFNILGSILYLLIGRNRTTIHPPKKTPSKNKQLTRDTENKMIEGVCSGIAKYSDMDVTVVRLLWVLMTFLTSGLGLLIYIIAAIIMPADTKEKPKKEKKKTWVFVLIIILLIGLPLIIASVGMAAFFNYSTGHDSETIVPTYREKAVQVITEETKVTLNSISRIVDEVSKEIILNPNYEDYNGYNLIFLGNYVDHSSCDASIEGRDCMRYDFKYDINTNSLPDSVKGFRVSALVVKDQILSLNFTEITE